MNETKIVFKIWKTNPVANCHNCGLNFAVDLLSSSLVYTSNQKAECSRFERAFRFPSLFKSKG